MPPAPKRLLANVARAVCAGTTPESALDKATDVLNKYQERATGVFAVCEPNATGVLGALENTGLAGKVHAVVFDPNRALINGLADGKLDGIVLQDPVKMGYLGVKTMLAHLAGEKVECDAAFYFLRQLEALDTPEHEHAFPGEDHDERVTNAARLEGIREDLVDAFDFFADRQLPRADVAATDVRYAVLLGSMLLAAMGVVFGWSGLYFLATALFGVLGFGFARFAPRRTRRGLRVLFTGHSGKNKLLAAQLFAHELAVDLFEIDLSRIVSKYVADTERNLDALFKAATASDAVLLFDDTDHLLGNGGEDSGRFPNFDVNQLRQRIESYDGVVLLGADDRAHMDPRLARQCDEVVEL